MLGLLDIGRVQTTIEGCEPAKRQVERIKIGRFRQFRMPGFGLDEFRTELIGKTRDDFVLHIEEIGYRLVETFGPQMITGLGIDQLDIHAKPVSATLNASLQHITHIQFSADLLQIDMFALVGKGGVASNDEASRYTRQIRGQALGHAVDEVFLFGIAPHIGEGEHHDRQARCRSRR